jgi:hypothetical protein
VRTPGWSNLSLLCGFAKRRLQFETEIELLLSKCCQRLMQFLAVFKRKSRVFDEVSIFRFVIDTKTVDTCSTRG